MPLLHYAVIRTCTLGPPEEVTRIFWAAHTRARPLQAARRTDLQAEELLHTQQLYATYPYTNDFVSNVKLLLIF